MFVCQLFVWFVIYSVVGWIWESAYCTAVEHSWQNRGFLYGPYCPIYGTGIVGIMLLWHRVLEQGRTPAWYEVFLVVMVGSAVLEYATHWALEKLFHAYWWDYSNMPLNLNGRICLPASVFFGLGGLLVVYVLYTPTSRIISAADPILTELFSLVLMALMSADTALTASSLTGVARAAATINTSVNEHMDRFVADAERRRAAFASEMGSQRAEAAQALEAAGERVRAREAALRQQAEEQASARAAALARERERFAETLRRRQLRQTSTLSRSAVRRAHGIAPLDRLGDQPAGEQFAKLWHDMLRR